MDAGTRYPRRRISAHRVCAEFECSAGMAPGLRAGTTPGVGARASAGSAGRPALRRGDRGAGDWRPAGHPTRPVAGVHAHWRQSPHENWPNDATIVRGRTHSFYVPRTEEMTGKFRPTPACRRVEKRTFADFAVRPKVDSGERSRRLNSHDGSARMARQRHRLTLELLAASLRLDCPLPMSTSHPSNRSGIPRRCHKAVGILCVPKRNPFVLASLRIEPQYTIANNIQNNKNHAYIHGTEEN